MGDPDYSNLRAYLNHPPAQIVTSSALLELLHPHDPSPDPEWPAPTLLYQARVLLRRLPHAQQVVCAATAAEMAFPLWEAWIIATDGHISPAAAPHEAITNLQKWLEGTVGVSQLKAHAVAAERASTAAELASRGVFRGETATFAGATAYAAKHAADAIDFATYVAYGHDSDTAYLAMLAVDHAAQAVAYAAEQTGQNHHTAWTAFIHHWWARCRCRLAFRDVFSANLE